MIQQSSKFFSAIVVFLALGLLTRTTMGACPPDPIRIKAGDPNAFDSFGRAVSISGNTVAVGAFEDDESGLDAGAAYMLEEERANWVPKHKLLSSDGVPEDEFGKAVAFQGDHLLIAALQHIHDDGAGNGSVYAFSRGRTDWSESQELLASDGAFGDGFGRSLSLSGDRAIIGAPSVDADDGFISGAAYVFQFDLDSFMWVEKDKLLPPELPPLPGVGQGFGSAVALSGDIAVIAMAGDDSACPEDPICDSGAAYVFRYDAETESWFA